MSHMNCRKCGSKMSSDLGYCVNCGAEIPVVCPNCKSENHPENVICYYCRRLLETKWEVSVPGRAPQQFSRLVAGKLLESKRALEGERKLVTVLFADVADYDELSENLDSERIFELLDDCFEFMTECIVFYGGTVGQATGKGFLAVFGAPIAYEDHAQRACRAALEIQKQSEKFGEKVQERYGIKFRMVIGLNSGNILVGSVEDDLTMDYSDIASTSDIAYKVKCGAHPRTTCLTENTYKLAEGFFSFVESGEVLAGIVPSLKLYTLLAESPSKTAFDVRTKRGLSPFVDRKDELNQLKEAYEFASQGNLLCISIVAESGIGKSRLLHEFKTSILDSNTRYLELKCLSHGKSIAYHPFVEFLKTTFNVLDTDDNEQVKLKVKNGLEYLFDNDSSSMPFLLELLSVRDSGIDTIAISPDSRKFQIMKALRRLLLRDSQSPIVFALEDLHWSDQSSAEFLNYLADMQSGVKILMILTYRPEFVSQSGGVSCEERLRLEPFPKEESVELIRRLLGTNVDPELEELILSKTEGVPFFIEEFLRSTKDLQIIRIHDQKYGLAKEIHDVAVPSTVNDAIMARVDLLPETAKAVLQTASAIEREFWYALIKKITGLSDEDLSSCFALLQESDLVYRTPGSQELKYAFRHALIREVVYDALVASGKRALHSKIADAIEEIYSAKLNEYYGILADHYMIGENYLKAAEYSKLASKRARKTASFDNAIAYIRKRVISLERLPIDEKVESELIDALTSIGLYYTQMNNHVEAKNAIEPIIPVASSRGENRRLAQIHTILGTYLCFVEENFERGLEKLTESLRISEKLNDIVSSVSGYGWMGIALSANGEFLRSLWFLEKALKINQNMEVHWAVSMIKSLMSALVYNFTGEIELGIRTCEDALSLAETSGDPLSKGMACGSLGMAYYYRGQLEDAEKYLNRSTSLLDKSNYYYWEGWAHYFLGAACLEMGRHEAAEHHHLQSISILKSAGIMPSCERLNELAIAVVRVRSGRTDVDVEKLKRCFQENRFKALQGWMARLIAETFLALDQKHRPEAENWIRTAIVADGANGMKLHLGCDYAIYGHVCSLSARKAKAQDYLSRATKIFEYCGAEGELRKLNANSVGLMNA